MRRFLIDSAIVLAVIGAVLLAYSFFFGKPEPAVIAQPAPELKGEATTTLTCKPVVIYRDKVAKELGVPTAPNLHVTDAVKVPDDGYSHTAIPVYDDQTGKISTYVRRDPLPWLALINQVEIGAAYGIKSGEGTVVRLDAQWDLIQIKAIKGGLYGQADSDGTGFGGVRVHIKF